MRAAGMSLCVPRAPGRVRTGKGLRKR